MQTDRGKNMVLLYNCCLLELTDGLQFCHHDCKAPLFTSRLMVQNPNDLKAPMPF